LKRGNKATVTLHYISSNVARTLSVCLI